MAALPTLAAIDLEGQWFRAEPWRRLESKEPQAPGAEAYYETQAPEELRSDDPAVWIFSGLVVLPSMPVMQADLILNGRFMLLRDRFNAGELMTMRPIQILPGNSLQLAVTNLTPEAWPVRVLLIAERLASSVAARLPVVVRRFP